MVFSSIQFIGVFLPILIFLYAIISKKYKMLVLLIGSLVFYGIGEPYYILILLASLIVNYMFSRIMIRTKKHKKLMILIILLWNFGILFFFKYFDFFAENINAVAAKSMIPVLHLVLPLGISFYTFQIISYQIDVFRGDQKGNANFLDFSLYVSMFPQLVAGPIVRFQEVEENLRHPSFDMKRLENGLKVFTVGLGLKVLLANQIGTLFTNIQGIGAQNLNMPIAWLGAFAYSFQIYFDFWGYSVMAIGLGEMFGFKLPVNFKNPYIAVSMTDFWRRWHITLSRWFKDYVYIPLGGNRKGKLRTIINLFIVWALTGLWHGANWNFVIWGLFFFVLLVIEKTGLGNFLEKYRIIGHLYCLILIPISWVIFTQTNLMNMFSYMKAMIGANMGNAMVGMTQLIRYGKRYGILILVCLICCTPLPIKLFHKYKKSKVMLLVLFAIFWFSIYEMHLGKDNPFLYFRF